MAMLVSTLPLERLTPVDEPPRNFDAATNPIIAKHWYGLHRTLGPGKRGSTAAWVCRERELRVIDGGRP